MVLNPITHRGGVLKTPPRPILQQNDEKCICLVSNLLTFSFLVLISFSKSLVEFWPQLQVLQLFSRQKSPFLGGMQIKIHQNLFLRTYLGAQNSKSHPLEHFWPFKLGLSEGVDSTPPPPLPWNPNASSTRLNDCKAHVSEIIKQSKKLIQYW